ncbi:MULTISPECIES: hypothetical protein [Paenibacillus]|uniref:Uncharacterized protein n=1 Tax=Paenibacillus albilobatus TaxID=2716884 RepID=A0A920CBI0_9BACL|nr:MULTISPECIES: hypothetical protein [Paenibacillus]MDR9857352.1 hypothetical protein [Paenibacillus sp. VCA1]GIO33581.1 hypothetical protein J2TS6_47220 [Paenibacillus albilobatus]
MSIKAALLPKEQGCKYILEILEKYKPWKTEGHLSIGEGANRLSTDDYEYSFSLSMESVPAFIFFEQNYINECDVVVVNDAKNISPLMENSHGMEYFISDESLSFLISVNWYSIEYVGDIDLLI